MINGIAASYQPYQNYNLYGTQYAQRAQNTQGAAVRTARIPAAQPETPVTPVTPVRSSAPVQAQPLNRASLLNRWENDPAAMAVRGRIQYGEGTARAAGAGNQTKTAPAENGAAQAAGAGSQAKTAPAENGAAQAAGAEGEAADVKSAQETMEEAECQTCKERKYQDGSDDPGVSFKTAAHIDPEQAAAVVRGHEQEHVVREQAKAGREGREVVSQSVTLHTGICPECGKTYVSGGTTRTVTRAVQEPAEETQEAKEQKATGRKDAA